MKEQERKLNNLTSSPIKTYPRKEGDYFMAENGGENMSLKPHSIGLEQSKEVYGGQVRSVLPGEQRSSDIMTLEGDRNLPVDIKRVLEGIKQQNNFSEGKVNEVKKNAALADPERMDTAAKLLKRDLTEREKEALLKAHAWGRGEAGKDNGEAGVYNYTKAQLLGKARILDEAGFSREDRRVLMEAGLVGDPPVDTAGITDPAILGAMDQMNAALDDESGQDSRLYESVLGVIRGLPGADPAQKKDAELRVRTRLSKTRAREQLNYRFSFSLLEEERKLLSEDPIQWINEQFDRVYSLAEEGQELNSPLIQDTQQKIAMALDLIRYTNPQNLQEFIQNSATRLHSVTMRTAIGYKDMDQVKSAAGQLRAHGLLLAMTLEGGKVGAMSNRLHDLLEQMRKQNNKRHHVMLEDALEAQHKLEDEQMDLSIKGEGEFGSLYDIASGPNWQVDYDKAMDKKNTDLAMKQREEEIKLKLKSGVPAAPGEDLQGELDGISRVRKIREVNAEIVRAVRMGYDTLVSTQRMGVIVSRGKYLLKDGSRYRSDPIGPLNVYNMEELLFGKFDQYTPEQEELVDRMKLTIADNYLKDQKDKGNKGVEDLDEEARLDLGKRLFRDLFAVPDFFSSGWRIEAAIQALEQRFESGTLKEKTLEQLFSGKTNEEKDKLLKKYNSMSDAEKKMYLAKVNAEEFALFMRLRITGQEQFVGEDKKKERVEVWEKIKRYRPEEIIGLVRERDGGRLSELYRKMEKIDGALKLTDDEITANLPDGYPGGRGKDLTVYDKFKNNYGQAIGLLRQLGFNKKEGGVWAPEQLDLSKLNAAEYAEYGKKVEKVLGPGGAERLRELAVLMREYIEKGKNDLDPKKAIDMITSLTNDNKYADIYVRSLLIDDGLLDKLEDDNLGNAPLSKLIGEVGVGGDTLVRSWNDHGNAAKGGNALLEFIKKESLKEKTDKALEFAGSAAMYNGLGSKGQAECVRYTIGTYMKLAKLDFAWDVLGMEKLPFRIPASEAQKIFGVQADAISRDELREQLDHLRGYLSSSISKDREQLKVDKEWVAEYGIPATKKAKLLEQLSMEKVNYKEMAKKIGIPEDEYLKSKYVEGLEKKFKETEEKADKFYKIMEKELGTTTRDYWKRTGFRLLLYLLLSVLGEGYMAVKESSKDLTSK